MKELERKLKYSFKDPKLLSTALVHSSYANENKSAALSSNERLEFLGDSVLSLCVSRHLYSTYPEMSEGRMTRLRAELVREQSLYAAALKLELGRHICLGRGEEHTGGRERPSILADCVEAVIAAIYLDGGMEPADKFVQEHILSGVAGDAQRRGTDYKTALQELIQQKSGKVVSYAMISESGPDHRKVFTAQVLVNNEPAGRGTGNTKKEAEQSAAKSALDTFS